MSLCFGCISLTKVGELCRRAVSTDLNYIFGFHDIARKRLTDSFMVSVLIEKFVLTTHIEVKVLFFSETCDNSTTADSSSKYHSYVRGHKMSAHVISINDLGVIYCKFAIAAMAIVSEIAKILYHCFPSFAVFRCTPQTHHG